MNEQELQNSLKELMKLVKASIESFGKYTKAKATGVKNKIIKIIPPILLINFQSSRHRYID